MISIVFPAYNEGGNVGELHQRILASLKEANEPFEVIAVNNASTDGTMTELLKLHPIKIITMAYNIGQTAALDAGIHAAQGDVIVIMDADLQNDPADIPKMLAKMREGYDVVVGWRKDRHDSLGRKIFSWGANWISRKILKLNIHDYACGIKMFKREFIGGIHLYGEMHVFLVAILQFRGARVAEIVVRHHERTQGLSKHTFIKGAKDLADLLTVKFLYNSTARPLLFFGGFALGSVGVGLVAAVASIILKLMQLRNFGQTPLPIMATLFIVLGFILFMMGFLAELMLRIYYEGRRETPYVIKDVVDK